MTNPNDPWGQRPEEAPTEHLGPPGKSGRGQPLHTTEYTEAYGTGAPSPDPTYPAYSAYPGTEYPATAYPGPAYPAPGQHESWAPPGPGSTRELPRYDTQWAAYQGYGDQPPTAPPGVGAPPGMGQLLGPPEPPRRNAGLWIALGIGVVLLIGAVGVVAGVLLGGKDSSSTDSASAPSTRATSKPAATPRSAKPAPSGLPGVPGVDGLGATMGTITANNGGTLTVNTMLGGTVTVRTDAGTQVISVSATKASDLPTGEIVLIQGDKSADGSILAKIIISTSLPGGGR